MSFITMSVCSVRDDLISKVVFLVHSFSRVIFFNIAKVEIIIKKKNVY